MIESSMIESEAVAIGSAGRSAGADALLSGPNSRPGPLEQRLRALCETVAELLADPDQVVRLDVTCSGACPAPLHATVVHAALELVANAVRHGFYQRLVGRVRVELATGPLGTRLIVADDGWGIGCRLGDGSTDDAEELGGQGLPLVRAAIAPLGGSLALREADGVTAEVLLPSAFMRPPIRRLRVVH